MPAFLSLDRRALRLRRDTLWVLVIAAGLAVLYTGYLTVQNRRAGALLEQLRQEDPIRYLDDLRRTEGFDSYLGKYRMLEGYHTARPEPPSFLIGRWTLFEAPQRVPTGTTFECRAPIVFERGQVQLQRAGATETWEAGYRIVGASVLAEGGQLGRLDIALVSHGGALDHLELTPPGAEGVRYAYICSK